ncbi:imidazolonepropionase [Aestuariibacter sp. AA17]|uniref:Imidazolonepropionase n=1 Tax=Fluctibacter corallii TaxID=2984329 RepID=A0ABT3A4Z6_9ALTE|nr:imidazolonepropionase [Aestuariibacter sp. AA17]MCV2883751.1 imidazolonepropionase [Aestuariibacter sp. AA17]
MSTHCDLLITNVNLATMQKDSHQAYGAIYDGCLAVKEGKILFAGKAEEQDFAPKNAIDGNHRWLTPGLIDCHTHLVYGGNRAQEFEKRLQGVSYEEISKQGGGINSTVTATRAASEQALLDSATKRARRLMLEGVTTIEVKSGYGLDLNTELRMLDVTKQLEHALPVNVVSTFLGAHTVPPEYKDASDDYVSLICDKIMPAVAAQGIASFVDVFCEGIGFSPAQSEKIFQAAARNDLKIKAHVEQLSDLKGAALAAKYHAVSVDHLEYLNPEDILALSAANTVAVMLPGAFYFLNEKQLPPINALREAGVPMAVATDLNPGSSPLASLLTAMNMACTLFKLTPEEALAGATRHGAQALALDNKGQLAAGFDADFCLWDIEHPAELSYGINLVKPDDVWIGGEHVHLHP